MLSPAVRSADPRVVKSQLDVIAAIDRSAWIITPVWALLLDLMVFDALFPALGDLPLGRGAVFPAGGQPRPPSAPARSMTATRRKRPGLGPPAGLDAPLPGDAILRQRKPGV